MQRSIFTSALLSTLALAAVPAAAAVDFGAEVVSRYVWRGTDVGNAVSIQPGMSYSYGSVEIGAWSSWAINGGSANENNLYLSFTTGSVAIAITDYYFPAFTANDRFFRYGDGDAVGPVDGLALGLLDGERDGRWEGLAVGALLGAFEGASVGRAVAQRVHATLTADVSCHPL